MKAEFLPVWDCAKPYLNTRSNDKHTLYCYYFAEQLLAENPSADETIVLAGILLHDVGWSTVPEDKQLQSFGPHMIYPELRRQHEVEGAMIAREILQNLDYSAEHIEAICAIIDGHDSRKESQSLNDSLIRDADKLWRYTDFGLETVGRWFDYDRQEQMTLLAKWIETRFYTDTGRAMARSLYANLVIQQTYRDYLSPLYP
ncbi:MAG: hypothetical protein Phog2KO_35820 [Phototrophicaceae bacterium]